MTTEQIQHANEVNKALARVQSRIQSEVANKLTGVTKEVVSRAYRSSNELRNASQYVLRGQRSGKYYKIPYTNGTKHQASSPGEAPAVRTGIFRLGWMPQVHSEKSGDVYMVTSAIASSIKTDSGHLLGEILEYGTSNGRIAPRPYKDEVRDRALPRIKQIFDEPYFG